PAVASLPCHLKQGASERAGFSAPYSLSSGLRFLYAGTRFLLLAYVLDSGSETRVLAETVHRDKSRALALRVPVVPVRRASVAHCFAATPADLKGCIPLSWGIVAQSPL